MWPHVGINLAVKRPTDNDVVSVLPKVHRVGTVAPHGPRLVPPNYAVEGAIDVLRAEATATGYTAKPAKLQVEELDILFRALARDLRQEISDVHQDRAPEVGVQRKPKDG